VLILTRSEVFSLLDMNRVIDAAEKAHAALATGASSDLGPASLSVPCSYAMLLPMTAALSEGYGGVKLLTDTPANLSRNRPVQQSTIALVNTETGACEAFLDGAAITQFRTAAASAVATQYLARSDAEVFGFVGAGALARSHLLAFKSTRRIRKVLVWSRSAATASSFADFARSEDIEARIVDSPQAVVTNAEIVCTLTPSKTPLVEGRWLQPGAHVNAVGAPPRRDHREIDTEGIVRSRVVVDSFAVARYKSGDVIIPLGEGAIDEAHFSDELGQIIIGRRPTRTTDQEITLYDSVGLAIQDIATAVQVVDLARRRGLGLSVDLSA